MLQGDPSGETWTYLISYNPDGSLRWATYEMQSSSAKLLQALPDGPVLTTEAGAGPELFGSCFGGSNATVLTATETRGVFRVKYDVTTGAMLSAETRPGAGIERAEWVDGQAWLVSTSPFYTPMDFGGVVVPRNSDMLHTVDADGWPTGWITVGSGMTTRTLAVNATP